MVITATMIAEKAGVSQSVVSKVLHGAGGNIRVSEETMRKVQEIAKELGYRRNAAARAMRRGRFDAIGLLFASRFSEAAVHPLAMWSIQQQVMERQLHLTMAPIPDEKLSNQSAVPFVLRDWSVDGLLVSYTYNSPDPLLNILEHHRVPAVWMNRKLDHDCVYLDDYTAGGMATTELLRAGHKRIGYLKFGAFRGHYSQQDRLAGYRQAMHGAGLQPELIGPDEAAIKSMGDVPAFTQWLAEARPSALVINGEYESSIMLLAAARAGMSVPQDLSISGIINSSSPISGVRMSGVEVRHAPMGEKAVELLMQKIELPTKNFDPIAIAPRLLEGGTTVAVVTA